MRDFPVGAPPRGLLADRPGLSRRLTVASQYKFPVAHLLWPLKDFRGQSPLKSSPLHACLGSRLKAPSPESLTQTRGRPRCSRPPCSSELSSLCCQIHEDTYRMQQGLQERVKNCRRTRTGQGSVYLQRVQCQQLERKLRRAEAWLLQMGKLARLVDFMICQTLVSIVEEEVTSFVANILQARRRVARVEAGGPSRPEGARLSPLLPLLCRPQGGSPFSLPSWSSTVVASWLTSPALKI